MKSRRPSLRMLIALGGFVLLGQLAACAATQGSGVRATRPDVVEVPGGRFRMGDLAGTGQKDELPVHEVAIAAFAFGRTEVTVGEFRAFFAATGYPTDAERNVGHDGC